MENEIEVGFSQRTSGANGLITSANCIGAPSIVATQANIFAKNCILFQKDASTGYVDRAFTNTGTPTSPVWTETHKKYMVGTSVTHATDSVAGNNSIAIYVDPTAVDGARYTTIVAESLIGATTTFTTQGFGLYTIRGLAGVKTGITLKGTSNQAYLAGVQGKLTITGVLGDGNSGGIYATAGLFQMQNTGSFGADAQLYGIWVDNQAGSVNGPALSHMVNITNNGGTITNAIKLYGGNNIAQFIDFDTCGGMITGSASTGGSSKQILIKIDGVQYHLNAYTA